MGALEIVAKLAAFYIICSVLLYLCMCIYTGIHRIIDRYCEKCVLRGEFSRKWKIFFHLIAALSMPIGVVVRWVLYGFNEGPPIEKLLEDNGN